MPTAAVGLDAHGTSSDVRDLKSLTKKKSRCGQDFQIIEANGWRNSGEGAHAGRVVG
jgi:hypothetical protein